MALISLQTTTLASPIPLWSGSLTKYSLPLLSPLQSFILYSLPYSLITLIKLSSIISLKTSSLLSIQSCSTSVWYWFISHSSHSTVFFSWLMISFSLAFFLLPKSFNSQYYLLLFFFLLKYWPPCPSFPLSLPYMHPNTNTLKSRALSWRSSLTSSLSHTIHNTPNTFTELVVTRYKLLYKALWYIKCLKKHRIGDLIVKVIH